MSDRSREGAGETDDLPGEDLVHMPTVLHELFNVPKSKARQYLAAGFVRVDGQPVTDIDVPRSLIAAKPIRIQGVDGSS